MRDRPLLKPVLGALALVFLASLASPASASAISIPNPLDLAPSLDPTQWAVGGFKAIIQYIFGDVGELGRHIVNLLLAVPQLTSKTSFPRLNEYRSYITNGCWGVLGLSLVVSSMRYWLASYGGDAYLGLMGFIKTAAAISIMLIFPVAFDALSHVINAFTVALIDNRIVGHAFSSTMSVDFTGGGIVMILEIIALVMALFLLVVKVIVIALLAVLFVLSPLAIALWPIEELSWALSSLLQAMIALMMFPVVWAACFGVFAVLPPDAMFPGNSGDFINTFLAPLITVATLIIAFRLPFAILNQAMSAGISPGITRGLAHAQRARSFMPSTSPTSPAKVPRSRLHPGQGQLWG